MTRAQERLIISGGCPKRPAQGTFFRFLQSVTTSKVGSSDCENVTVGSVSFPHTLSESAGFLSVKSEQQIPVMKSPPDLRLWIDGWAAREKSWLGYNSTSTYLTPTSQTKKIYPVKKFSGTEGLGALPGILTHRVLETWDFKDDLERLRNRIEEICDRGIPSEKYGESASIRAEVFKMLETFHSSPIYRILQGATIIGREVPFTVPWDCVSESGQAIKGFSCVMEGVIDLVYQLNGQYWVADYKTDHLSEKDLSTKVTYYQEQMGIYKQAARRCLGLHEVKCHLFFFTTWKSHSSVVVVLRREGYECEIDRGCDHYLGWVAFR